jgi:hypothetical protein
MAITVRSHRADRGSIPRLGVFFICRCDLLMVIERTGRNNNALLTQIRSQRYCLLCQYWRLFSTKVTAPGRDTLGYRQRI